jgi:uncharacterized membrane protein YGL010W
MSKLDALLNEYAESHQNALNKKIHYICVPFIYFSIVGMLFDLKLGEWNGVEIRWVYLILTLVMIYYARLKFQLMLVMLVFSVICIALNGYIESLNVVPIFYFSLVVFVLAWIGQFYGHKVEGKKPSFLKDLQFLLIGPAWILWKR